jgi:hypothetical protein
MIDWLSWQDVKHIPASSHFGRGDKNDRALAFRASRKKAWRDYRPFRLSEIMGGEFQFSSSLPSPTTTAPTTPPVVVVPPVKFTARWIASDTNTVPTETEITEWSYTSLFNTGGPVSIPFNNFIGSPKFLKWAEPATEPPKTKYYINVLDNDVLGSSSTWNTGIIVGQYRLYMPNGATETDNVSTQFKVS